MSIAEILNTPYPTILNKWKVTISVSIFISFFLSIFQPFGLQFVDINNKTFVLLGYGMVTFILLVINLFLLPLLFKNFFQEEKWTVGKQIIWLTYIVLIISIGNYGYSILFSIFRWVGIKGFLIFILFTFPIAIIPIVIITFISQNVYLKRNLHLSARINKELNKKATDSNEEIVLTFDSGTQQYQFPLKTIIFLESEGNYVNVNFIEKGEVKTVLIRNTIKNITEGISEKDLFKCHRAFAINIQFVEKVRGNSHGISIRLKHIEKQIPVSRNNTKAFTELLSKVKI